jgi:hypothetical protein
MGNGGNTELRAILSGLSVEDLHGLVPDLEVYPAGYWINLSAGHQIPQADDVVAGLAYSYFG